MKKVFKCGAGKKKNKSAANVEAVEIIEPVKIEQPIKKKYEPRKVVKVETDLFDGVSVKDIDEENILESEV